MNSTRLAAITAAAVAVGVLAGCGGSGSSSSSAGGGTASTPASASATASAAPATSAPPTSAPATAPGTAPSASTSSAFVPIVEPFDPGHPAHAVSFPASCAGQSTTLAIVQCYEHETESYDAEIDLVQQGNFQNATVAQQTAINAQDSAWLTARHTVCAKAYQTGGTIDQINIAACLASESDARLLGLRGTIPPEAVLKSTDSTSLSDLSWYTAPDGTRLGMIDTQGDSSGGAVIAWVIIAGPDGFVVNPAQFYYSDGAFIDKGTVQPPAPASGYKVATGAEYQFSVDYSNLKSDPNAGKGTGGWVYVPSTSPPSTKPVAVWR